MKNGLIKEFDINYRPTTKLSLQAQNRLIKYRYLALGIAFVAVVCICGYMEYLEMMSRGLL